MKKVIYIHKPPHHFDEICAIPALALALELKMEDITIREIDRVEASLKQLKSNEYMVDVGDRFDGERYFDHHQDSINISAFGRICDTFDCLKVLRKSTIRKYVDSIDTRGRAATLNDMGVSGVWKDKFEIFPELIMCTSKADKGNFKSLNRIYDTFKWTISWDNKSKVLTILNKSYYENNHRVFNTPHGTVLYLPNINPETGTTGGIKDLIKKYKAGYTLYPGKYESGLIMTQCDKLSITVGLARHISNEINLHFTRINDSLYTFGGRVDNKLQKG